MPSRSFINAIGTALPVHDVHQVFIDWASDRITDPRARALFARMAGRAGIEHRWSVLPPTSDGGSQVGPGGFYGASPLPSTAARMAAYAREAPRLAHDAVEALGSIGPITHLVVASCTGFIAPGIDQVLANALGLSPQVERTLVGFMGCYAAVAALRLAHHIVRSRPDARVLVVTVELSTLHLQEVLDLEPLLAMLLFGDGAAAALVSAEPAGYEFDAPFSLALPQSDELITWSIGDSGFAMHLSGAVPARIAEALADPAVRTIIGDPAAVDGWAVHAGGRTVLDAVEAGLGIDGQALATSRDVLRRCGNMSSATLMFALADMLAAGEPIDDGRALAFGPGLAAEGFRFRSAR